MKTKQTGFTLVEIAIVLVIIGLLLGGILKGQEMINQAKIKNVISDFNGIAAAYYGYQDRYRAIPGDDGGAAGRWTAAAANIGAATGDGNGTVAGKYNNPVTAPAESNLFWNHLRLAGFVSGTGGSQPNNAATGMIGVETGDGAAVPAPAMVGTAGGFVGLIMCSANLPDKIAIAVDTQMDDGQNDKGQVRGQKQVATNPDIKGALAAGDVYVEDGTSQYTLCRGL
jgi:prepilin-type N-terminal cleavage/methylation domain-containing protein